MAADMRDRSAGWHDCHLVVFGNMWIIAHIKPCYYIKYRVVQLSAEPHLAQGLIVPHVGFDTSLPLNHPQKMHEPLHFCRETQRPAYTRNTPQVNSQIGRLM